MKLLVLQQGKGVEKLKLLPEAVAVPRAEGLLGSVGVVIGRGLAGENCIECQLLYSFTAGV